MRKPPFAQRNSIESVGFDHRIGHFRPLRMATKVLECHIYLRLGRLASTRGCWGADAMIKAKVSLTK
jgi:hypothetical protein